MAFTKPTHHSLMQNRAQTIDLLKGIAVLLMIQVHIVELFSNHAFNNSITGKLLMFAGGPPVAPVFVLLMGYFLAASKKTTVGLIKRGVKVFCLGMLLNIALNFNLILSVGNGTLNIELLPYIFGIDILQFAGLAIVVIALLKNFLHNSLILIFTLIIISASLGNLFLEITPQNDILKYISALFYGSVHWSYFPLLPWLSYPLAGFAFYQIQQKYTFEWQKKTITKLIAPVLFICLLFFTGKYAVDTSAELPLYYHHALPFFLWVIAFICFYAYFINGMNNLLGNSFLMKYLKWIGKNVTLIYIIQWIIIGNVATELYKTISSPSTLFFSFFAVLALTSLLAYSLLSLRKKISKPV